MNDRLLGGNDEPSFAQADLHAMMEAMDIATVFVDRDLRILHFTARSRAIFNFIPGDVGRPLLDITHRLRKADLAADIRRVLEAGEAIERELGSTDGHWYIARVSPMRGPDGGIDGAVLTFMEVTRRTRDLSEANAALRREIVERRESEAARGRLLRQVVSAQEDERRRIARELHDQLGQEVTALGLKLAALKLAPELAAATREQIGHLQEIVRQLDSDVDFLVSDLRPTGLDDLGLAEALSDYVANWSKYFAIPAQLRSRLAERLQPEVETVLYRIAQESLTNVAKHARAGRVDLALERDCDHVSLSVTDDGIGFDPRSIPDAKALGLVGMRERAALVGGCATIVSRKGAGTSVRVTVPMREALVARLPAGPPREGA